MRARLSIVCAVVVVAAACDIGPVPSGIGADDSLRTLLVTNAACLVGPCVPLEVGGWPADFALPCPSQGCYFPFDTIAGPSACVRIPAALSFFVHEVGLTGRVVQTDTLRWTLHDPIRLIVHRLGEPRWYTDPIVPESAAGWRVAVVAGTPGTPTPSSPCVP